MNVAVASDFRRDGRMDAMTPFGEESACSAARTGGNRAK